jgi:hypothetical protein
MIELQQPVGEEAEIMRDPRHDAPAMRAQQRAVVPRLDLGETIDIASTPSAILCSSRARSSRLVRPQVLNAAWAASTA